MTSFKITSLDSKSAFTPSLNNLNEPRLVISDSGTIQNNNTTTEIRLRFEESTGSKKRCS